MAEPAEQRRIIRRRAEDRAAGRAPQALRAWEASDASATNGQDEARVYFEDEGGAGAPVILHHGFADSVQDGPQPRRAAVEQERTVHRWLRGLTRR